MIPWSNVLFAISHLCRLGEPSAGPEKLPWRRSAWSVGGGVAALRAWELRCLSAKLRRDSYERYISIWRVDMVVDAVECRCKLTAQLR